MRREDRDGGDRQGVTTHTTTLSAFESILVDHKHDPVNDLEHMATDIDPSDDEDVHLDHISLEAHHQVLEMSRTIEVLTLDFQKQQKELALAYKKIQELSLRDLSEGNSSFTKLSRRNSRSNNPQCCAHDRQLQEAKRLVALKDTALREACEERNALRSQLEKAHQDLQELQSCSSVDAAHRDSWQSISSFPIRSSVARGSTSSPAKMSHKVLTNTYTHLAARTRTFRVPRRDRFDEESNYQRTQSAGDFWKQQYKDAVRLRKQHGLGQNAPPIALAQRGPVHSSPSMRIFSYPDNTRQKGITDEQVPFARYIGISARQNAIIKEHHRILR